MGIALSKKHPRWDQILTILGDGEARKPQQIADAINLERWRIHCVLARMVKSGVVIRTRIGPSISWYSITRLGDLEVWEVERTMATTERPREPEVVDPQRIAYASSIWSWGDRP